MKILTVHNRYQLRGGEDEVHDAEEQLLRSRGQEVRPLTLDNAAIGGFGAVFAGLSSAWSPSSYERVAAEITSWRPDIVNVHNFFPLATPAVHYAAARAGVPVVQTLHNFRTLCPNAILFREGKPCEQCLGKMVPWPGITHACYRDSYTATAAVAAMISVHNLRKTWQTQVTLFFALSEFARQKFIQAGFPADRVVVKPNFVSTDLGPGSGDGDFILYAGRLSEEKGISLLLDAWAMRKPQARLLLAGDGPLAPLVRERSANDGSIQYLGRLSLADTYGYMGKARALAFPSLCYEGMPRVIIESFSRGTPVIANRSGSMAEMIRDQETGWLVDRGDCVALADALCFAFSDQFDGARVRSAARAEFERNYTANRQYDLLMNAYHRAIEEKGLPVAGRQQTVALPSNELRILG
jgi:glycosyltransferase involved in cell wall biosynthesis